MIFNSTNRLSRSAGSRRAGRFLLLAILALCPAAATGQQAAVPPFKPALAEFMILTQIRHSKLWLAGNAGNWDLADYQIDELKEGLEDAAKYVPDLKGLPVAGMIESTVMPQIGDVEKAIKAKDRGRFAAAYDKLTAACNTCHHSAGRPYIVIQRPAHSVFPNQSFAPRNAR